MLIHNLLKLPIALLIFLFAHVYTTNAAPMPLTSSSLALSDKKGLFRSSAGFSLHLGQTNWVQFTPPKNNEYIETIYRASKDENIQAALTVRLDPLKEPTTLASYSKKWIKDYPRFGFDVLAAKNVRVGSTTAFMLDLINRDNSKQIRQVLFVKNKHAVSLTCRDDKNSFQKTLKSCNEIIRTFQW